MLRAELTDKRAPGRVLMKLTWPHSLFPLTATTTLRIAHGHPHRLHLNAQKNPKMRYYEQKYPEVDELVMVQVRQIAEMGAYVKLVCPSASVSLVLTSSYTPACEYTGSLPAH